MADGRVQHADGSTEEAATVCSYPHYLAKGMPGKAKTNAAQKNGAEANTPSAINGWVENANATTGSANESYGAIFATWIVPARPLADDGQVLYYFPGFEDINSPQPSILQPVLGWYQGQWTIASWNCCLNGIVTNSPAVNVASGDLIYGSITSTCAPGALSCAAWNVLTVDMSTGENTTLGDTPSDGQIFNWAFGGVLEAYYVSTCDDYPLDHRISFDTITVFDQNLHPVRNPKWATGFDSTDTPQCHYGVKAKPHEVTLEY
jgi:hypothetical protein